MLLDIGVPDLIAKVLELAEYIARSRTEADQAAFKQAVTDTVKSIQGQEGSDPDVEGKRRALAQLVDALNGVGEGSDRGACLLAMACQLTLTSLNRDRGLLQPYYSSFNCRL